MRMKSLILIVIALGCGLVASIGISQVLQGGASKAPVLEMEQILVALADIDINSKLDATNVKLEDWPKMKVPEGAVKGLTDVEGKFALQRFYAGEPILLAKIGGATENSALRIPEGYRVMPVRIEEDTVLKGIAPGDRVDVNVFLRRNEEVTVSGVHTILKNVRVFAVGSNTERSLDAKGQEIQARTVSLLVKPPQARELGMASQVGKIFLVLRHPGEATSDAEDEDVTPLSDILSGKSSDASEGSGHLGSAPGSGASFVEAIKTATPAPTPEPAVEPVAPPQPQPGFVMTVFGPGDVKQYEWANRNAMPVESAIVAGTPMNKSTATTPAAPPRPAASPNEPTTAEPTPGPTTNPLAPVTSPNEPTQEAPIQEAPQDGPAVPYTTSP